MTIDINKRAAQYVALRDKIKSLEEQHKNELAPYREALAGLNALLLSHLHEINTNSASSNSGTVYITKRRSASIVDMKAFWDYVTSTGNWDLLDRRANSTEAFALAEKGTVVPGVNLNVKEEAGVRRPTKVPSEEAA